MGRRATLVLIFAAVAVGLLLKFPGPLFRGDSKVPQEFRPGFTENLPMDSDDVQTLDLRRQACSAMAELQAKAAGIIRADAPPTTLSPNPASASALVTSNVQHIEFAD